ncbi:MAG: hypothetical protein KDD69_10825 [Bdellovibrionales bacterium]|nr:hypothetical protein [Bdellovibrionales bacterium]
MRLPTSITSALAAAPSRRLTVAEIRKATHGFLVDQPDNDATFWVCSLPDRLLTLPPVEYDRRKGAPAAELTQVLIYGDYDPLKKQLHYNAPVPVVTIDHRIFFVPAVLPFRIAQFRPTEGIVVWVQVDVLTALKKLHDARLIEPVETLRALPPLTTCYGIVANLLELPEADAVGLFSMAELTIAPGFELPILSALDERTAPFPGLEQLLLLSDEESQARVLEVLRERRTISDALSVFEAAVLAGELPQAEALAEQHTEAWRFSARAHYARGCLAEVMEDHGKAARHFFEAQRLDHFAAPDKLLAAQSREAKPFRDQFPEVFDWIRRGERLRALTTLRGVAPLHPLVGNAILSYCLRNIGAPEEGLRACEASLNQNPYQPDVLSNMWSFLVELEMDEEAKAIAARHLSLFPSDLSAISNYIDALLLTGDIESALLNAHRYLIESPELQQSIKQLFKVYERAELWPELAALLDEMMLIVTGPTSETLSYYGEALIEVERFAESEEQFERALVIEPGNAKVVLGYGRALARAGREDDAIRLLRTVLSDPNRIDKPQDKIFVVTLLAEILRRTGTPEASLESFREYLGYDVFELTKAAGPFPALEYTESLLLLRRLNEAQTILASLAAEWPTDPHVLELVAIAADEQP